MAKCKYAEPTGFSARGESEKLPECEHQSYWCAIVDEKQTRFAGARRVCKDNGDSGGCAFYKLKKKK